VSALVAVPASAGAPPLGRIVVKLGGRVQQDPRLAEALAALDAARPGALCLVHGGGDEISALQRAMGVEPEFVDGRRITSTQDLTLVRMALSGTSNKRLVSALVARRVAAVGISGEDAGLLAAAVANPELGRVGRVERVDGRLLEVLVANGYVPVISPVARDMDAVNGCALNVNGDDAAAAIAAEFGAEEILFLADVPGVLVDGKVVPTLDSAEARALVARGTAVGGMAAKLEAAQAALAAGVRRARIGGLEALGDDSLGTQITLALALA
jgi:acetylglutamate kinase